MKRMRRNHGASCKASVALAAVKGDKTLAELAEPFSAPHPDHRREAPVAGATRRHVLRDEGSIGDAGSQDASRENLATGAGERFIRRGAQQGRRVECNAMIDRTHPLPVVRPCQRFGVARSTASYQPTPVTDPDLALRRWIDELHLPYPFAGARMLRLLLQQNGQGIGRRRGPASCSTWGSPPCMANPAPLSGILPIDSTPNLLRGLDIVRPSQVGRQIVPTVPCVGASCIFSPSWTGRVAECWRGGCPIR